eukprot:TCONS_00053102-protein
MMVKQVTKNCAIATLVFGVLHVVIGITLFACCFVFSATITGGSVVAPYWTALPIVILSIMEITLGITKNHCLMIAVMVLNIIFCLLSWIATAVMAVAAGVYSLALDKLEHFGHCMEFNNKCYCDGSTYNTPCRDLNTISTLLDLFAAFNALAAIVCLCVSITGCVAVCCKPEDEASEGQVVQAGQVRYNARGGQTVIINTAPPSAPPQPPPYSYQGPSSQDNKNPTMPMQPMQFNSNFQQQQQTSAYQQPQNNQLIMYQQ